jgi:tape measure domain-containing protein
MSRTIDERVVQMAFENSNFEKNVGTSLSTIDKLKKSLNFDGIGKGFAGITSAANKINLGALSSGIENISNKFSALGILGVTTLVNIANSAYQAGLGIVKALTVDPIKAGLSEYETKLNSVQTILANTQKEGTNLQTVTAALNELNEYSDKTIYNFQQMARNVGTFTAAGVKLETSVAAIKGIANLAAISGSNADQASTAMYQLSQALSSGSVKLMDWNSVVNAGMGGQVFQDAIMETARVHGVAVDQMIEEDGSFRETLQRGWFTSEILTETLAKFTGDLNADQLRTMGYTEAQIQEIIKMGQTASDAATKVKTFSQLFDTLKEAAQSGWAQTWEIIIGDFNEAKTFLTDLNNLFGGMIGASAQSRNDLLSGWKDLGGREALIESVRNVLDGLLSVIKPVNEALREIFPKVTVKQLFALTEGLKKFTERLTLTEGGASTLKRIFKGLFALVDIVVFAFTTLTKSVFGFSSTLKPGIGSLIEFIAKIGDFIVKLRDAIRGADGFGEVIEVIKTFLAAGSLAFKKFFNTVANTIGKFKSIKLDGLSKFIDKLKGKFKPLTAISDAVVKVIEFFKVALSKIAPIAIRLSEIVSSSVSKFITKITEALGKFEPERIIDIINGGLLSAVLLAIKKFVSKGSGVFGGIAGVLDSVKDSLSAWQTSLKADVLIKIALALGIMALSLLILATIDKDKLTGALAAMTAMFIQLGLSLASFSKMMSLTSPMAIASMAVGLVAIAVAMLIMATAVHKLGTMDSQELVKGMLAIVSMIGLFSLAAKVLSKSSGHMIIGAAALIIFSFAIRSLAKAVIIMGQMDPVEMARGLTGVGVLIGELALFMRTMNIGPMALTSVLGILVLAGAIAILVKSVQTLSEINGESLFKALAALGLILTELSLFVYATAGGTTLILTAAGIAIMAVALIGLTSVMERLGALSWDQIGKGLTAIAAALTIIGVASYLLPPHMILQAAGLVVMAVALGLIGDALKKMGSLTGDEMAIALLGLAGSLLILSVALIAMNGSIGGAAALFIAAAGLMALAPALKILGSMSWEEIGRGLAALAATLLLLGIAGALMTPVIPTLLGLGVAMILIGAGMALAGLGLLAFSAGLAALAISGSAGVAALVVIISAIIGLIPMIVATLGRALLALVDVLVEGAPKLLEGIVLLLNILLDGLIEIIPKVVDVIILLIEKLLTSLAAKMPVIIQAGYDILKGFLEGVRANIGEVVTLSIEIINAYLNAVAARIPELIDSGWKLIIAWIDGMKEGVEANLPELITSVQELGLAIIKGLAKGLIDGRNNAVDAIKELAQMVIDEFKYILGINSPSTVFIEFALNMITGLVNGLSTGAVQIATTVTKLANSVVDAIKTKYTNMVTAGSDLVSGFGLGITNYIGIAVKAATQLAMSALNAIKKTLGIDSPAKELIEVGKFADIGLSNGITKFSDVVLSSIENLGKNTISEFSNVIGRISDAVNSNMDVSPTIRPVIDMTEISKGGAIINRLFGDQKLNPSLSTTIAKSISVNGTETTSSSSEGGVNGESKDITFIQNNNSPKALSPIEVYRSTKNLLSRTQKVVGA